MFKIQETNITDTDDNGVQVISITVSDDTDMEKASQYVVLSVQVQRREYHFLEKVQLGALRQAAGLLDEVADAIDQKFQRTRGIRG